MWRFIQSFPSCCWVAKLIVFVKEFNQLLPWLLIMQIMKKYWFILRQGSFHHFILEYHFIFMKMNIKRIINYLRLASIPDNITYLALKISNYILYKVSNYRVRPFPFCTHSYIKMFFFVFYIFSIFQKVWRVCKLDYFNFLCKWN